MASFNDGVRSKQQMFNSSAVQMVTQAVERASNTIGFRKIGVCEQGQAHHYPSQDS